MIGQTISHYKILEKVGEGGMGIVYKAQDTKLKRTVALKFLPPHLSASEQDKARFMQEAQAASALNHPNVCTIHDIQEHEGRIFIVMEFVDGQTLQDLFAAAPGCPLPRKRAIEIGIQVADGLAAAHEKGIVHRDVKPENIMVRKDGIAQIMDFGLAKLRTRGSRVNRLTKEGSTVGTAGYMSPEQIQGQEVDHRSDIFSLGVLLYELFVGQMPFKGVHETALMYEIVNLEPTPLSSIDATIDPALNTIVLDCLEKDPKERCQSAAEVSRSLRRVERESNRQTATRPVPSTQARDPGGAPLGIAQEKSIRSFSWMWIAGTVVFFLTSVTLLITHLRESGPERKVYRASILPQEKMTFFSVGGGNLALSPDGKSMVYVARDSAGKTLLWLRNLNALTGEPLSGTDGAENPFWSPDGRFIGFFAGSKLKKIEISGGPPQTVCDAAWGRGGTWNKDDVIVFSPRPTSPLFRVPAAGGQPTPVTKFDPLRHEDSHRWPCFLPDGKHFLFLARTMGAAAEEADAITLASLDSTEKTKIIVQASSNVAYAAGYLLFVREQSLMAQLFDPVRFRLSGDAIPLVAQIKYDASFNKSIFSATDNGLLVYQAGVSSIGNRQLVWFDRTGKQLGSVGKPGEYIDLRISPDGGRVAVALFEPLTRNYDLWLYEMERDVWTRFTFDASYHRSPIWSPDGSRIAFTSNRSGHFDLYQKNASGAGNEDVLLASDVDKVPTDWSADGRFIAYLTSGDPKTKIDSWILPMTSGRADTSSQVPFLRTEFNEGTGATFSPDGKWLAYQSDESGRDQVYVRPMLGTPGKWQISTAGGTRPHWRRDGKELFYLSEDNFMMATEIKTVGSSFELGAVRQLFKVSPIMAVGGIAYVGGSGYDAAADGKRFLVNVYAGEFSSMPITLVVDWDKELKAQ